MLDLVSLAVLMEHTHTAYYLLPPFFQRTQIHPEWAPVVLYIVVGKYLMLQLSCWSV